LSQETATPFSNYGTIKRDHASKSKNTKCELAIVIILKEPRKIQPISEKEYKSWSCLITRLNSQGTVPLRKITNQNVTLAYSGRKNVWMSTPVFSWQEFHFLYKDPVFRWQEFHFLYKDPVFSRQEFHFLYKDPVFSRQEFHFLYKDPVFSWQEFHFLYKDPVFRIRIRRGSGYDWVSGPADPGRQNRPYKK
jgi:hypothetical protein